MSDQVFTCDKCGQEFPQEQMKEVFLGGDGPEKGERRELCASCLDKKMNEAPEVYGVPGDEKRRAVKLEDAGEGPPAEATGKRE